MIVEKLIFKVPYDIPDLVCSAEGLAFISAHEAATGTTMGTVQKQAICGFVSRLMGNGTTYGSDIWTTAVSRGAVLYPLCPIDDSTANANAYSIDLFSQSALGTFNNFIAGDITPNGVIGGSTKYFDSGVAPSAFNRDNVLSGAYCRNTPTILTANGSANTGGINRHLFLFRSTNDCIGAINTNSSTIYATSTIGLLGFGRLTSATEYANKNGALLTGSSTTAATQTANNVYFHGQNIGGVPSNTGGDAQLAMYYVGMQNLTVNELADFYEAVQWYQTNVITGGRNV